MAENPLEQWPEDEGSAPYARPEPVSILRLLLRAAPRVSLAVVLAFLYAASKGATALAFLLSWLLVVGSMLLPRWRRYVETGQKGRAGPTEPLIETEAEPKTGPETGPVAEPAAGTAAGSPGGNAAEDDEPLDPRDAWELPDELPGDPPAGDKSAGEDKP